MTYRVKREGEDFFQAKTFCMFVCFENNVIILLELCRQTSTKVMLALILSSAGIIDDSQLCRQTIRKVSSNY